MVDTKEKPPKEISSTTQEQVRCVTLEKSLECEDEKYRGIGDLSRIKILLAKKMFHCKEEYHYFMSTPDFPAFKVKTSLLQKHQEVFPADYTPRRARVRGKRGKRLDKFEKTKKRKLSEREEKPINKFRSDMITMENEWLPQIDDPKIKYIASRARLTILLRDNRYWVENGYHFFHRSGVFPLLKIKSAILPKLNEHKFSRKTKEDNDEPSGHPNSLVRTPSQTKMEQEKFKKLGIKMRIRFQNGKSIIDYS